jgi:glycosyltransferase involved in cell wall biosynthesis
MSGAKLTVLIVARNEEQAITDCLESARFADEVLVVLDRSTDRTGEIAAQSGARLLEGAWINEGERRNAGIAACSGDWILELDADERISAPLRAEISQLLPAALPGHYLIPFHNHFCGRFVLRGWGAYNGVAAKYSLFAKGHKIWGDGTVHPPIHMTGHKGKLSGHLEHYVDRDLAEMIERLNWYSTGAAQDAVMRGKKVPHGLETLRCSISRFLKAYVSRKGYREGWRGLALGLFSALYPVLTHFKMLDIIEKKG